MDSSENSEQKQEKARKALILLTILEHLDYDTVRSLRTYCKEICRAFKHPEDIPKIKEKIEKDFIKR